MLSCVYSLAIQEHIFKVIMIHALVSLINMFSLKVAVHHAAPSERTGPWGSSCQPIVKRRLFSTFLFLLVGQMQVHYVDLLVIIKWYPAGT